MATGDPGLRKARRFRPNWAAVWIQLGHAIQESGDLEGAESAYRRSTELDPLHVDGWLMLSRLLAV